MSTKDYDLEEDARALVDDIVRDDGAAIPRARDALSRAHAAGRAEAVAKLRALAACYPSGAPPTFEQLVAKVGPLPTTGLASAEAPPVPNCEGYRDTGATWLTSVGTGGVTQFLFHAPGCVALAPAEFAAVRLADEATARGVSLDVDLTSEPPPKRAG